MHTTGVKVNVDVTSPPRAHRASLGCKSLSDPNRSIDQRSCWLGLGLGLFKQRSTKEYLTRKLKSSSEVCEGYVILDSYAILCESKTSSSPPKRLQGCDCAVRLNAKGMSVSSDHERPTPRPHFDSQLEAVVT